MTGTTGHFVTGRNGGRRRRRGAQSAQTTWISTMDATMLRDPGGVAPDRFLAATHEVVNQPTELADYNLYAADRALQEAVAREGAASAQAGLLEFGRRIGAAGYLELGRLANQYPPEFEP